MLRLLLDGDCQLETEPRSRERGPGRRAPSAQVYVRLLLTGFQQLHISRRQLIFSLMLHNNEGFFFCFVFLTSSQIVKALHVQLFQTSSCGLVCKVSTSR